MGSLPFLTLVVPLYNPPANWYEQFSGPYADFRKRLPGYLHGVIFVDDGSSPPALPPPVAGDISFEWIAYQPNRGKGHAVRAGEATAPSGFLLFTDVDFPYEPASAEAIVRQLEAGADVVPGIRDQTYFENISGFRRRLSLLHSWLIKRLFRLPISDTQCGLKGFSPKGRELLRATTVERFLFDLELISLAFQEENRYRARAVVVELRQSVQVSSLSLGALWRELGNFLRILWAVRISP